MSKAVIQFHDLGHAYTAGRWLFKNYRAEVNRASIFAVLGPNGSGKTTLLKILMGALKPTVGRAVLDGRYAFVPQLFQVTFDYSVLDMVLMGRARHVGRFSQPSPQDEQAAMASLDRFGMADFAHRPFHELSGGERQLVIFARALVTEADILILDEPTSALDLRNQGVVLEWIDRLARQEGLTVAFTTHHPHHAYAVADEALLMFDNHDHASGAVASVLTEENLCRLYGVEMRHVEFEHDRETLSTFVPVYPGLRRKA